MFNLAVFLMIVGIVLLIIEAFIPGFGVFGGGGILAIVASAVIMALFVKHGWIIVIGEFALIGSGVYFLVKIMKKHGLLNKLVLDDRFGAEEAGVIDLTGYEGREGVTLTALRPVGTAEFDGKAAEVYSDGAFIPAGEKIIITGTQNQRITVKPLGSGVTHDSAYKPNHN